MAQSHATATTPSTPDSSASAAASSRRRSDVSDHFSFAKNSRPRLSTSKYPMKTAGARRSSGASFRVWKNLGVGRCRHSQRTASGSAGSDGERSASVLLQPAAHRHGHRDWHRARGNRRASAIPVSRARRRPIARDSPGGPSWLNVEHEVVTDVTVTESYPFDTAAFGGARDQDHEGLGGRFQRGRRRDLDVRARQSVWAASCATRAPTSISTPVNGRTLTIKAGGPAGRCRDSCVVLIRVVISSASETCSAALRGRLVAGLTSLAKASAVRRSEREGGSPGLRGDGYAECPSSPRSFLRWSAEFRRQGRDVRRRRGGGRTAARGPRRRQHHARVQAPGRALPPRRRGGRQNWGIRRNIELKRGLLRAEGLLVGASTIRNFSAHRARLSRRPAAAKKRPRRPDETYAPQSPLKSGCPSATLDPSWLRLR